MSILPTTTWSSPANFGTSNTGLTGTVGFAVVNPDGSVFTARTTSGVTEYPSGSGIYWPGTLTFVIGFRGGIIWDTGGTTPKYAVDALNLGSNDTNGRTQIQPGTAVGQISLTDGAVDVISFNGNLTVGGKNWYNTFRYISATTAGLLPSGAGSNTESWQDFGGAAAVSFTVDAHGNRTGAVYS